MLNKGLIIGLIQKYAPVASPEDVAAAVAAYLEDHPEIVVEDGSITEEKLSEQLAGKVSDIPTIKSGLESLFVSEPFVNIYTPQDMENVLDGYILKNGVPQTQYGSGYCVSDYIPVTAGDTLTFNFLPWNASTDSSFRAAEYNSNKEYIKRLTGSPVTLSENTAYIRFSIKKSDFGGAAETAITHLNTNLIISNGSKVQFSGIDEEQNQFQSVDSVMKTGRYFVDASNYEMLILSKMNGVNNKDIGIKMKHFVNNDSWQFCSFGTVTNNTPFVSNEPSNYVEFMSTGEDFFGPIVGFADNNGDGDDPNVGHFTGGMHRFNSKNTARVISFDVYYDGRKIPGFVGYCDTIDIIIKQNLQASNTLKNDGTGREVVQEIIRLHFENGAIKVETEFIALEGMSIGTFYFMQGNHKANGMGANGIRYIGSEANRGINSMDAESNSGDLYGRTMRMLSDVIQMDITIDDVDLGRFTHVTGNNVASAFVNTYTGYSKCYFNVIRSSDNMVHLDEGDSCIATGSIRFGMFE